MADRRFRRSKTTFLYSIALFMLISCSFSLKAGHATALDAGTTEPFMASEPTTSIKELRLDPKDTVFALSKAKFKQGQWEQAARYARQLISMAPEHPDAHGILGAVYAITGAKEAAKKELTVLQKTGEPDVLANIIEAILAAQAGKFKEAEDKVARALEQDPGHPVAVYYSGSINLAQDQLGKAEQLFKRVIAAEPEFAAASAGLGQVYLRQKKVNLAVDYYKRAVTNQPENMLYRKQLIDIYRSIGMKDDANRETKAALYYVPGVKQNYLKQGMQLLSTGAYKDAISLMDKVIGIYEDIPQAYYIKAAALANLKETDSAAESIETFIARQWGIPQAHHYAGMCYLALNQIDKAENHFKIVIALNPGMGISFVPLTVIEQIRGNYDRALEGLRLARTGGEPPELVDYLSAHMLLAKGDQQGYLKTMKGAAGLISGMNPNTDFYVPKDSISVRFSTDRNLMVLFFFNNWYGKAIERGNALSKLHPGDRFAWNYMALSYDAQNKIKDAIDAFNQLVLIEPELVAAHMKLGQLYLNDGQYNKAENTYRRIIEINRGYASAYVAMGDLFMQTGAEPRAIQSYKKTMEVDPDFPGAYHRLAMIYAEKPDKLDEALELALTAEALAPQHPVSLDVLGWVYVQRGDIDKAIEKLEAASKQLPNDPLIHYHMGVAYYKNNDPAAAKKALQTAVRSSQNFKGAEHAEQLLSNMSQ